MDAKKIGNRIAVIRKQKGLSQSELAKLLNVSNKLISKWECGGAVPDIEYLKEHSRIFEVDVVELLSLGDKEEEARGKAQARARIVMLITLMVAFLPFTVAVIAHGFLPAEIPMHYNSAGEIDRWGSSFEMLIIGTAFTIAPLLLAIVLNKIKLKSNKKIIVLASGNVMAIVFTVLQIAITVNATKLANAQISIDVSSITCTMCSMLFVFLGVALPYVKQNPLFGIRISATMNDPINWEKTHKLASPCFALGGAISAFLCAVTKVFLPIIIMMVMLVIMATIPVVYSIRLCKRVKPL